MVSAALFCLVTARSGSPQRLSVKFTIDPKSSLAWWQIVPHLGHLWATTCPQDPSWLPGEGRQWGPGGFDVARATQFTEDSSKVPLPLFPRYRVRSVCAEAVHGELVVPDSVTWKGAHGKVVVNAAALTQASALRDAFAHNVVLDVDEHPQIVLTIDSVVAVMPSGPSRDTVRAVAVGILSLHGVDAPLRVPVVAWHDGGGLRVEGRWSIVPSELTEKYQVPKVALSLGVGTHIWKALWVGTDLVMHPEPTTP
jgi:YceI-like protein